MENAQIKWFNNTSEEITLDPNNSKISSLKASDVVASVPVDNEFHALPKVGMGETADEEFEIKIESLDPTNSYQVAVTVRNAQRNTLQEKTGILEGGYVYIILSQYDGVLIVGTIDIIAENKEGRG